jgi:hypothetical protein
MLSVYKRATKHAKDVIRIPDRAFFQETNRAANCMLNEPFPLGLRVEYKGRAAIALEKRFGLIAISPDDTNAILRVPVGDLSCI